MFILKVTNKQTGQVEQSDFQTEAECETHKLALEAMGYSLTDSKDENGNIVPALYSFEIVNSKNPIGPISPRQIRLALLAIGITDSSIESAINMLSSELKDQAMIAWKYSTSFERNQPAVDMIGTIAGLNSEQLDALWIAGANL